MMTHRGNIFYRGNTLRLAHALAVSCVSMARLRPIVLSLPVSVKLLYPHFRTPHQFDTGFRTSFGSNLPQAARTCSTASSVPNTTRRLIRIRRRRRVVLTTCA